MLLTKPRLYGSKEQEVKHSVLEETSRFCLKRMPKLKIDLHFSDPSSQLTIKLPT